MKDIDHVSDADLEAALTELGAFLAVPTSDGLVETVKDRLAVDDVPGDANGIHWRRLLVAAAVLGFVVSAGLVAYGPTRTAIADWLGIGAVEVRQVNELPPQPAPGATVNATQPPAAVSPSAMTDAQNQVSFSIRAPDPRLSGPATAVTVEPSVPGGLVSVTFGRFRLTEIAAQPDQRPVLEKLVSPSTRIEYIDVNGRAGAWITGAPHELAYLDPHGQYRSETLRQAGNVLMWEQGGVTFRIEGLNSRDDALALAASMR